MRTGSTAYWPPPYDGPDNGLKWHPTSDDVNRITQYTYNTAGRLTANAFLSRRPHHGDDRFLANVRGFPYLQDHLATVPCVRDNRDNPSVTPDKGSVRYADHD